ncbi:Ras-related protein R-Ras2 isoform X2 [Oopsacas minuta]|uniref:Ras-related protein R-Ras2 isoform X2 n=1 Tax=Oopsacas minuta TaxID=111878 RepID=A0AAV7JI23_9METZ|nr:Ras-related protein R-Ras2 isoform X2 [Oopsacas minuta]
MPISPYCHTVPSIFNNFITGPSRSILIQSTTSLIENEQAEVWRVMCDECGTLMWDVLAKLLTATSNCLISNKIKNMNSQLPLKPEFVCGYTPTIEEVYEAPARVEDSLYILQILDTAGTNECGIIREDFYHQCDGYLLVFSVIDRFSLQEIKEIQKDIKR